MHLTPAYRIILGCIVRTNGGATSSEILYALYTARGLEEPDGALRTLHVMLCRLRPLLAPHGVHLFKTHQGQRGGSRHFVALDEIVRARVLLAGSVDQALEMA